MNIILRYLFLIIMTFISLIQPSINLFLYIYIPSLAIYEIWTVIWLINKYKKRGINNENI